MSTLRHAAPGGHIGLHRGFPSSAERVLSAAPASVPKARRFVADTLAIWGLDGAIGDSVQVVAELAANAVREGEHGAPPEILLRLACSPRYVIVQAGDHNLVPPPRPPRRVRQSSEHGRGLPIARVLSRRLAWYQQDGWKIVWAAIPIPAARPHLSGRERWGRAA